MNEQTILLALSNAEEVRIFTGFLKKCGFEVSAVRDGAAALESVIDSPPALVITDPELSVISGERIFQITRHNPKTTGVPFLFVSDSVTDIKGFHAGVDVFLVRPLNLEEVRARIFKTLRSEAPPGVESTDMEGRLSHISIADLLQFLQLNSKEGELQISSGATRGSIFVKEGQIYNAVAGGVEKEKALYRLLALDDGKFQFIPRQISIARKVKGSTGSLLMEGMRQIDEYRKRRDQLPDPELNVALAEGVGDLPEDLSRPVFHELVSVLASRTQVADIIDHCSWPDYEAISALNSLISRGLVVKTGFPDSAITPDMMLAVGPDGELVDSVQPGAKATAKSAASGSDAEAAEGAGGAEFLTRDQAISIREKVITRFADALDVGFARVMVVSSSGGSGAGFIHALRRVKGVKVNHRAAALDASSPYPLGEVATYKLYGGMDLVFTSVPSAANMGPVYTAFSTNIIGLVLVFDYKDPRAIKDLVDTRRELLKSSTVPVSHVYIGANAPTDEDVAFFRKTLGLKPDEPVFVAIPSRPGPAVEAVYSIFSRLLKEDRPVHQ